MQRIKDFFKQLLSETRRAAVILGIITIGLVIFSLSVIKDLVTIKNINDVVANSIPVALCLIGIITTVSASASV